MRPGGILPALAGHPATHVAACILLLLTTLAAQARSAMLCAGAGGWLFYGLYTASQAWWFLSVCLAVFAFMLVALSFFLTGREFLFPVALVTAFIGGYPLTLATQHAPLTWQLLAALWVCQHNNRPWQLRLQGCECM